MCVHIPPLIREKPRVRRHSPLHPDPPRDRTEQCSSHLGHVAQPAHLKGEGAAGGEGVSHAAEDGRAGGGGAEDPVCSGVSVASFHPFSLSGAKNLGRAALEKALLNAEGWAWRVGWVVRVVASRTVSVSK
jgi:hypothetical protein